MGVLKCAFFVLIFYTNKSLVKAVPEIQDILDRMNTIGLSKIITHNFETGNMNSPLLQKCLLEGGVEAVQRVADSFIEFDSCVRGDEKFEQWEKKSPKTATTNNGAKFVGGLCTMIPVELKCSVKRTAAVDLCLTESEKVEAHAFKKFARIMIGTMCKETAMMKRFALGNKGPSCIKSQHPAMRRCFLRYLGEYVVPAPTPYHMFVGLGELNVLANNTQLSQFTENLCLNIHAASACMVRSVGEGCGQDMHIGAVFLQTVLKAAIDATNCRKATFVSQTIML